ncbi:MAG: TonB C-terminal domain-containing protein [Gemmatimonadota bacterium]|nr:TonB C-terminal domain-containing protein [Gemmatimonadota bacterium]MDE2872305.1 TonB C-terminal domain-containing protein [Gemmatimonadota bacterium]
MTGPAGGVEETGSVRRRPLDRGALGVSLSVHFGALVFLFGIIPALQEPVIIYEVVQLDMVAAALAPEDELVVETPEDPPPAEEEAPIPEPEPEPEPEPDSAETPLPAEEPPPPDPEEAAPTAEPEDGDDAVTRRVEAFRRDYPEYYENIQNQIERCFRWQGSGRLEVLVTFRIRRDGTTTGMEVAEPSGNHAFDIDALGAVECAGMNDRLGPLPDEYPFSILPVRFTITSRVGGQESADTPVEGSH